MQVRCFCIADLMGEKKTIRHPARRPGLTKDGQRTKHRHWIYRDLIDISARIILTKTSGFDWGRLSLVFVILGGKVVVKTHPLAKYRSNRFPNVFGVKRLKPPNDSGKFASLVSKSFRRTHPCYHPDSTIRHLTILFFAGLQRRRWL